MGKDLSDSRGLVFEAVKMQISKALDSGLAQKAFDNCREKFSLFHVLHYIMYSETLTAFDLMEVRGLMRHEVKRNRKYCEREWARYQNEMRRFMADSAWYLVQDYCCAAHSDLAGRLEQMRLCFHNYLLKSRCRNSEVVAQLCVALKIADVILILWPKYFETYRHICGLDFSVNFKYADMSVFIHYLKSIGNLLSGGNVMVNFNDDVPCANAMAIVEYRLSDEDFLDEAAMTALSYSQDYQHLYDKVKAEKEDREIDDEIKKLSEKFDKVTRIKKKKK